MEIEGVEQQIFLQPEMAIVGAVYSVNGYTGHVVLTTSDLENTSGYQTSTDVATLISAHNTSEEAHPYIQALISAKQDPIVAGNGISITGGNTVAIDTTVVATQQNLATEVTNRENADIALQGQIDAISASSDVVDIVGTYADLQNYDTSKLKDNDIIKVLQDSTQGNATTYYRWSTTTQTFTLIGQEGPYYTKAGADAQFVPQTRTVNSKPLSANITLTASDVSALGQSDIVQTTGTSTTQVMSQNAVTTALATKLDSADVPAGFFDGPATTTETPATSVELNNVLKLSELQLMGDTTQDTTTGKNLMPVASYDTSIERSTFLPALELPAGTYNISFDITSITLGTNTSFDLRLSLRDSDGVDHNIVMATIVASTSLTRVNKTFTIAYDAVQDARSNVGIIQTAYDAGGRVVVGNIQIEAGSEETAYEPYTGGVPSPNPDYPQTVNVVTGTQTVTVTGKNLFDRANAEENKLLAWVTGTTSNEAGSLVSDYIPVTPSEKLKFTYNAQVLFYGPSKDYIGALQTDGTTVLPSGGGGGSFNRITVPSLSDIAYMRLGFRAPYSSSVNLLTANIQVEKGEVATTYEPYQGQFYTVELGSIELYKIGNYQDYIYKSGDDWYVHKATGKVVLDGSETWSRAGLTTGVRYFSVRNDINLRSVNSDGSDIMSDKFIGVNYITYYSIGGITGISHNTYQSNNYIQLFFATDSFGDTTALKTWLSTNNTTVYYALATATDTKITDTTLTGQLDVLLSAQMYPEYTAISSNGNLPAILGITVYNSNLNGIIEVLASTASTLGNVNSALNVINNGGN